MKALRSSLGTLALVLLVAGAVAGCDSMNSFLSVEQNPNQPDRERALSSPSDVESLLGGSFFQYWSSWHLWNPTMGFTNAASEFRGGFPFAVKRTLGRVPRKEWNNSPSFGGSGFNEGPWNGLYGAISSVNDGITAIETAREEGNDQFLSEIDAKRAEAFGKFVQGISHASIAAMFDRGFIITEDSSLVEKEPSLASYKEVMSASMQMFDEAIEIAKNNQFQLEPTWINGHPMTSSEFVRFVKSVKARKMTQVARTPEERQHDGSENPITGGGPGLINWNKVITLVDEGIQEDFAVQGDGLGGNKWGMFNQWIMGQSDSWGRMSYYTVGPADNKPASSEKMSFGEWLATETTRGSERPKFTIHTQDRRIVGEAPDSIEGTEKQWEVPGTDYYYLNGFASKYAYRRYTSGEVAQDIINDGVGPYDGPHFVGPIHWMLKAELDLMKAEGLLRTDGSLSEVRNLINNTRVERGKLPPATSSNPTGSPEDPPKNGRPQNDYNDVSLWSMVKYEKTIEQYCTAPGLSFFDKRGWQDLVKGTPLHFPIPGSELVTLQMDNYTFGGSGEYAAEEGWSAANFSY